MGARLRAWLTSSSSRAVRSWSTSETLGAVQQLLALADNPPTAVVLTAVPPRGRGGDQARQAVVSLGFDTEYDPRGRAAAELRQLAAWALEQ